jgi:predicted Ser/Thr protein kinase
MISRRVNRAIKNLGSGMSSGHEMTPVSYSEFLRMLVKEPELVLRNIHHAFCDMVNRFVERGDDEYAGDPESIGYDDYNCTELLATGSDNPFFADRIFANRLIKLAETLKQGAQQNRIYIFDGPPGCGKSTFLTNLLRKFEQYSETDKGKLYETVWRLDRTVIGDIPEFESIAPNGFLEIPCPNHCHPIMHIPKELRGDFLDDLFVNSESKWRISDGKQYDWVFSGQPCTICASINTALLYKLQDPEAVFRRIMVRPYRFNRRTGDGITVFNPGDKQQRNHVLLSPQLQQILDKVLPPGYPVRYAYSRMGKTNNGIYALMDIKQHNKERMIELHNIVSEGVHKVEDLEESVNSLFLAVMNPEDSKNVQEFESFSDRIEKINISYVLDLKTEVEIYRNIFGAHIDQQFLPRVLHNIARTVIATRLKEESEAMDEWIDSKDKYKEFCDANLQLLKMEIYTGYIPPWLSTEDRKNFTADIRKSVVAEAEHEGRAGWSGRDTIKMFGEIMSHYASEDKLINMSHLVDYYTVQKPELGEQLPSGFLDALVTMYNSTVLNEVRESLFIYNEEQISRDLCNYMFALSFEKGDDVVCPYTTDRFIVDELWLAKVEKSLLETDASQSSRQVFREEVQREYTSKTLSSEISVAGKNVTETALFKRLKKQYEYHLKAKSLDPLLENDNFRRAIKDYKTVDFVTYDSHVRDEVVRLISNLQSRHRYTEQGAIEVSLYVIDQEECAVKVSV